MYSTSKKIAQAQRNALTEGNSLVIYETFRPYSVQRKVASAISELITINSELDRMINNDPWSLDWFIPAEISSHQLGCAIDVGLLKLSGTEEYASSGGYLYLQTGNPDYYDMPTPIHEISVNAVAYKNPVDSESDSAWKSAELSPGMLDNPAAQSLQKYCTDAGLTPLASKWWHFNDLETLNGLNDNFNGDFTLTDCYSVPPVQVK